MSDDSHRVVAGRMAGFPPKRHAWDIRQHGTHEELTGRAPVHDADLCRLDLDAIIVPGSRPAANLDHAVMLAKAARCWLLVVCSQRLHGTEVEEFLAERSFRKAIVIDLPPGYRHELLEFPRLRSVEKDLPRECNFYTTDLSMKRNIGLVLARMLGWKRIFFLDDDIRDIAYPNLQTTVDMLGSYPTVGMRVTHFPDNSIVCHANRETRGSQDVFVSGAALAVNCDQNTGFFPDIYNEDWFFFFDNASNGKLANSYLEATQLAYYPFASEKRAAWQEFGDVLAEGLYTLLHLGRSIWDATPAYWAYFLEARWSFLEGILTRLQNADLENRDDVVAAVKSALKCLGQIEPELCARYIQAWREDLQLWKLRMAKIPAGLPQKEALARLGLVPTDPADKHWRIPPNWDKPHQPVSAGPVPIPQIDTMKALPRAAVVQRHYPEPFKMGAAEAPPGRHRKRREKWGLFACWPRWPQVRDVTPTSLPTSVASADLTPSTRELVSLLPDGLHAERAQADHQHVPATR